ncbi:MAG: hypothetical protein HY716_06040 [Planctomycetes bacterium]|nr:hypothetical protein [Planctomycetota bacterium]
MAPLAGVFLVTLSGLMFEIALTRIFSATLWYHFAFIAVSAALMGWGLGGLGLHLLRRRIVPSFEKVAILAFLYGVTLPLSLALLVRFEFRPELIVACYAVPLVPFLLAGATLAMVFDLRREDTGRLYFADLVGAAVGAIGVTILLVWLGGEGTVVAAAIAPFAASACFAPRFRIPGLAGAILCAGLAGARDGVEWLRIRPGPLKAMYRHTAEHPGARVAQTGWNAYSRIDAVEGIPPYLARLYIDSDAWTNVLRWDGRDESVAGQRESYRAYPFRLAPRAQTLIIGPGGGADVQVAIASGSERVTAVELNPLMVRFVRRYGAQAGNLYDHPKVETILSEGRNFISRTDRKFDVIYLGFVDSWASVASGGLSLSENYLYTTEAFRVYFDRLTDDGMLVILRWETDIPRLVANAAAFLGPEAAGRVAVLMERRRTPEEPPQMMFILRRRPFTESEAEHMMAWDLARPVIVPGRIAEAPYGDVLSGRKTLEQFAAESSRRVDPVHDDSPFYFAVEKPWGMPGEMVRWLKWIVGVVAAVVAAFVLWGRPRGSPVGSYAASICYFAALGLGFIAVELALLQNLTLLLGHPVFTLSVLLFTLLAAGGMGSWASGRFACGAACLMVMGLGIAYAFGLPILVEALLPLPLSARIAVAVGVVAPLGFAMGMPFPKGLRMTGRGVWPAPPFYWGLNGLLSVVGSVATITVSVTAGFRIAMIAGSLCYGLAAVAWRSMEKGRAGPGRTAASALSA